MIMNQRADDDFPAVPVDLGLPPEHVWFASTLPMQGSAEKGDPLDIIAAVLECCLDAKAASDAAVAESTSPRPYGLEEDECLEAAEEDEVY